MIDNLCSQYEIKGMSRTEIENLLGEPDFLEDSTDFYIIGDNENGHNKFIIYYLNDVVSSFEIKTEMYMSDIVKSVEN